MLLNPEWKEILFLERNWNTGSSDKKAFNVEYGVKVTELNDGKFQDLGLKEDILY